jgi:hypothetical protein
MRIYRNVILVTELYFLIWIHIITIFYHLFSEYTLLLRYNLTNTQFFKLSVKIKIKIKYMVWININININIVLVLKLITPNYTLILRIEF